MTQITVNNPKISHKLGNGGVPKYATHRLELLVEDYKKSSRTLEQLGFNSNVLNIEPQEMEVRVFSDDDEAEIHAIIDSKTTNGARGLYTCGIYTVICDYDLEAAMRV